MSAPAPGSRLCRLDAVGDGDCVEVHREGAPDIVVMRSGDAAWAYINVCPHFSLPLNSQPDEFLVINERRVMCAWHCAVFRFEDGRCIEGPAEGMSLEPVPIEVVDGEVRVRCA